MDAHRKSQRPVYMFRPLVVDLDARTNHLHILKHGVRLWMHP
ncbi:hypothetical protein C347_02618 [Cryptococcus neoformans AD2-60a]|nr:hypothetical protein C347_02618 [Cryptococcus neoformans var. grubii AD2-60a]